MTNKYIHKRYYRLNHLRNNCPAYEIVLNRIQLIQTMSRIYKLLNDYSTSGIIVLM